MRLPLIGRVVDERFLNHRLRSTSLAGIIGALVALGLFAYRYYGTGVWSWDLFTVATTFVVVKITVLIWYALRD